MEQIVRACQTVVKDDMTTLQAYIRTHKAARPLYLIDLSRITRTAQTFTASFPGKVLFASKANPDPAVLRAAHAGGIHAFDVASLSEMRAVKSAVPEAELHFMHVVKAPEAIHAAYHEYGVRHFVLDHEDELFKIMRETDLAQDLNLTVRIALPHNADALIDFSAKFGAPLDQAVDLLAKCRPISRTLSLSFHVGTQTIDPQRYAAAIDICGALIREAGVTVDAINVGGGFPVPYADQRDVCSVQSCVAVIGEAMAAQGLDHLDIIAEPGRVVVAQSARLVTRVELRKGDVLYLNDGVYGGLFDAADWVGTRYPVFAISCDRAFDGAVRDFRLAGPTCDAIDMLGGVFALPADIGSGDWVVFENVGAYSQCLRSDFNGFGDASVVYVA